MSARILVVDDIESNVRLLQAKLSAEYYEVLTANDGPTALAIAGSERPDIVLLDVMMPGMDGPATLAALRRIPATARTPVIFMTAKVQGSEIASYAVLGALGVIPKPFSPMTFPGEIRRMLEKSA